MRKILFLFFFLPLTSVYAQQLTQYSLDMLTPYADQPAYAGMEENMKISGAIRGQWLGIPGQPTSQRLLVHSPIGILNGGIGLHLNNTTQGAINKINVGLGYSFHLNTGSGTLGIGGRLYYQQLTLNGSLLRTPEGDYPDEPGLSIHHNDGIIPETNTSAGQPDIALGVFYKMPYLQAGIALQNLLGNNLSNNFFNYENKRHYLATIQGNVSISNRIELMPSVHFKSDGLIHQTQISLLGRINDNIITGAAFRGYNTASQDAVVLIGGLKLNNGLMINYAYDIGVSQLKTVHQGSHEIALIYYINSSIGKGKLPPIIYNPRSL